MNTAERRPVSVPRVGWRLEVSGTVQGVGFRPFVHRLATELGLDGSVRNTGGHVVIDVAGDPAALKDLARRLATDAPPLARVRDVGTTEITTLPGRGAGFRIDVSEQSDATANEVPPDISTCDDCLAELNDPADRRYRYPFINCTNCGPRATIIDDLPYDRSRTAMHTFAMCSDCRCEYEDPSNRRFHAEPIACPACGPALSWRGNVFGSEAHGDAAMTVAASSLRHGAIVALKGLGGYQLVCDATRQDVVVRLRTLKHRVAKPLAVMVPDVPSALELAEFTTAEQELLTSWARPIVLVPAKGATALAPAVNEGAARVGIFLPNTALHHLLLSELRRPLIVTSGNCADQPMAIDDNEAQQVLADVADGFLMHDRPILNRYDDSVVQATGGRNRLVRRARGYAPEAQTLPIAAPIPLLAVGAELKHTFALAAGCRAVISPHIGDLENADAYGAFTTMVERLGTLVAIEPELVVHDLHPAYLSTQYAWSWAPNRRIAVQHHHAHVAACAAEFGISTPFIGVAYDGLGMGDDGTLWGGEVLISDLTSYRRFGRFSRAPLPGGAAAVRRPLRMALGYLLAAERFEQPATNEQCDGFALASAVGDVLERVDAQELTVVQRMLASRINCPQASSAGRLFDAVASLLSLRDDAQFEGEAAIALEDAAVAGGCDELPWSLRMADGLRVYDVRPTMQAVVDSVRLGVAAGVTAARFHQTIVAVTVAMCEQARSETGIRTVCLGGGVFQNQKLATRILTVLGSAGFDTYLGEQVPANDGGISFGQVAVAAARTAQG